MEVKLALKAIAENPDKLAGFQAWDITEGDCTFSRQCS
jgi:hypothetical protein